MDLLCAQVSNGNVFLNGKGNWCTYISSTSLFPVFESCVFQALAALEILSCRCYLTFDDYECYFKLVLCFFWITKVLLSSLVLFLSSLYLLFYDNLSVLKLLQSIHICIWYPYNILQNCSLCILFRTILNDDDIKMTDS